MRADPNEKRILVDNIEFAPDAKSALKGTDCPILMSLTCVPVLQDELHYAY